MDRDENAAINLYRYPQGAGNGAFAGPTRVEIGDQAFGPVPVVEARTPDVHGLQP